MTPNLGRDYGGLLGSQMFDQISCPINLENITSPNVDKSYSHLKQCDVCVVADYAASILLKSTTVRSNLVLNLILCNV